jgi:DNA polymerase-3 subunit beta
MKITIPQPDLQAAVATVARGVSGRSLQPVQNNICLDTTESGIRFRATDLEYIGIEANIGAEVEQAGSASIAGRLFPELVATLPDQPVTLYAAPGDPLTVECAGATYRVAALNAQDFQYLPDPDDAEEFSLPECDLRRLLASTLYSCSQDETRPILTGVLLWREAQRMRAVSTDTYRLSEALLEASSEQESKVLLSRKLAAELVQILDAEGSQPVHARLGHRIAQFSYGNYRLSSRLIDGNFPNFEKIIPTEFCAHIVVPSAVLAAVIKRALLIARDDSNRVVLHWAGSCELRLTAHSNNSDSTDDSFAVESGDGEIEIGVNGRFLLEALDAAGAERVSLSFTHSLGSILIKPEGRTNWQSVVMSMQIM